MNCPSCTVYRPVLHMQSDRHWFDSHLNAALCINNISPVREWTISIKHPHRQTFPCGLHVAWLPSNTHTQRSISTSRANDELMDSCNVWVWRPTATTQWLLVCAVRLVSSGKLNAWQMQAKHGRARCPNAIASIQLNDFGPDTNRIFDVEKKQKCIKCTEEGIDAFRACDCYFWWSFCQQRNAHTPSRARIRAHAVQRPNPHITEMLNAIKRWGDSGLTSVLSHDASTVWLQNTKWRRQSKQMWSAANVFATAPLLCQSIWWQISGPWCFSLPSAPWTSPLPRLFRLTRLHSNTQFQDNTQGLLLWRPFGFPAPCIKRLPDNILRAD